jgi:hypothetical protein
MSLPQREMTFLLNPLALPTSAMPIICEEPANPWWRPCCMGTLSAEAK